jgi:hypothetical protein
MKRLFGIMALLLVAFSGTSFAQGVQTGTIRGTVKDQQGLALPGATISATSPTLQGERTVVTGTDGSYLFRAVPPGTYHLKVEMSGMSPVEKTADVPLGGVAQIDITLSLSQVQETVTVAAETPTILATPVVGANITHEEVEGARVTTRPRGNREPVAGRHREHDAERAAAQHQRRVRLRQSCS